MEDVKKQAFNAFTPGAYEHSFGAKNFAKHRWNEFFLKYGLTNNFSSQAQIVKDVIANISYCSLLKVVNESGGVIGDYANNVSSAFGFPVQYKGTIVIIKGRWIKNNLQIQDMLIPKDARIP